eukprot:gene10969-biopygen3831
MRLDLIACAGPPPHSNQGSSIPGWEQCELHNTDPRTAGNARTAGATRAAERARLGAVGARSQARAPALRA